MVHQIIDKYTSSQWKEIQNAAHQIAGRKPKRNRYNLRVPRHLQDRRRQSAFKDIANSDRNQVRDWVREDGSHNDHIEHGQNGSLSNAFRHTLHVMHHVYRRDLQEHHDRVGGGLFEDVGNFVQKDVIEAGAKQVQNEVENVNRAITKDIPKGLERVGNTLEGTGKMMGVQADIAADDFLNKVGIRKQKRYHSAHITDEMTLHARLNKEVYKGERGDVDGWSYLSKDSNNDYGVWEKDGEAMMVFRGTDPSKAFKNMDLVDDGRIATGTTLELDTNKSARDKMLELLDRYGDHKVNTSGYSLGGGRQLQLLNDNDIYSRLGDKSYSLAPGLTAFNPNLKKYSTYDKVHYVYGHNDMVANSLLANKNDNHSVFYNYSDGLKAHLFLDDLAGT